MVETHSKPALLPPAQISPPDRNSPPDGNSPPNRNGNGNGTGKRNGNGTGKASGNGYFNGYNNGHDNGHTNGNRNGNGNGNGSGIGTKTPPPLYTARAAPSTPRRSIPTKILGKIDEDGGMSPDIPIRNPQRKNGSPNGPPSYTPRAIFYSWFPTISAPKNDLENVTGPRGEKLNDARQNRRLSPTGSNERRRWPRKLICLGIILVIVAALVAIGVVIGLKRMHGRNNDDRSDGDSSRNQTAELTGFPIGAYTFTSYLLSQSASCTPNPATWRCYPYALYSENEAQAIAMLDWIISGTNTTTGPSYTISCENPFQFPFNDAKLTLNNKGLEDEYWGFSTVLEKIVYPDVSITTNGNTARCYYNESMIGAKLYTKRQTTLPGNETINEDRKPQGAWPGALEIWQTASQAPECYEVVGGGDAASVPLNGAVTARDCSCNYADFLSN